MVKPVKTINEGSAELRMISTSTVCLKRPRDDSQEQESSKEKKRKTGNARTLKTKSQTTVLVAEMFDSMFKSQVKLNRAEKHKLCICRACQRNNCGTCEQCKEMISFGGLTADSQLLCEDRQCLKMDIVVTLGADEEKERKNRKNPTWAHWITDGRSGGDGRVHYDLVDLNIRKMGWKVVKPGSYLLVIPDKEGHKSVPDFPCRLLYLMDDGTDLLMAHVQRLARTEDTILGMTGDTREWFLMEECENIQLSRVSKVLDIEQVKVEDIDQWRKLGGTTGAIMKEDVGGADGYWRQKYQPEFGRFVAPTEEEIKLREAGECYLCQQRRKKRLEAERFEVSKDGRGVRIKGTLYRVGQFIMLTDNTLTFKVSKKKVKVYSKKKIVDSTKYPEYWRKPDVYEGDHHDTRDPFQVVRLEEVERTGSCVFIRVRKLYRPEDTHLEVEEARARPLTVLYWSDEDVRIDVVKVLEDIVAPCWVTTVKEDEEEAIVWTDKGEDRFFISSCYDGESSTFSPLSPEVVTDIASVLASNPAPVIAPVQPLKTLDIFSGCGGLSHGLGQAGVFKPCWAVDSWSPSAKAYKKNNPECKVFNEDCNQLLKQVMKGNHQDMPRKGEVDMLVGGPPCQGFSLLNNYKESECSKFKNSQITTFLGYCDFYRPRFFILENVRNLVAIENGMVLKLILATLVKMGYQVGFNILQAGHYGVAQTRRRLIVTAAAPDETLPRDPEPVYNFCGPLFCDVIIDNKRYKTTTSRPGAPRRALTVWDSISDLPKITSSHDKIEISYGGLARSHLQRLFRANCGDTVRDHVTKEVNSLTQERIRRIPTIPGSDWRDLPNISFTLNGRFIRKLHYGYTKPDGTKRICSCSLSGKCDKTDKQTDTFIPWFVSHSADRHSHSKDVMSRASWDGIFKTTIANPKPLGKQGKVLHPEQHRLLSVREFARSQGFPDSFQFSGTIRDRHREIGNAVPPPLGRALGLEIRKAIICNHKTKN